VEGFGNVGLLCVSVVKYPDTGYEFEVNRYIGRVHYLLKVIGIMATPVENRLTPLNDLNAPS